MRFALALVLAVVACKGGDKAAPKAGSGTNDHGDQAMKAAKPAPVDGIVVGCDKLLPKDLRDKYLAGFDVTDTPRPTGGECMLRNAAKPDLNGSIIATCNSTIGTAEARDKSIAELKRLTPATKDLDGVGAKAVDQGDGKLTFYTDKCMVNVNAPKGVDAVALAKDVLPNVK